MERYVVNTRLAVAAVAFILLVMVGCGTGSSSDVTINSDNVMIATKDVDFRFSRGESLSGVYMLFGGIAVPEVGTLKNIVGISCLNIEDARNISKKYPDFYKCESPGAALAQSRVAQLNLMAADSGIAGTLKEALDAFNANIRNNGDRVCLKLEGIKIKMESAVVRALKQDMIAGFPAQEYYLITAATQLSGKEALDNGN